MNMFLGRTNTQDALELANEVLFSDNGGDRKDKVDVIVILTDGKSSKELNIDLEKVVRFYVNSIIRYSY